MHSDNPDWDVSKVINFKLYILNSLFIRIISLFNVGCAIFARETCKLFLIWFLALLNK